MYTYVIRCAFGLLKNVILLTIMENYSPNENMKQLKT